MVFGNPSFPTLDLLSTDRLTPYGQADLSINLALRGGYTFLEEMHSVSRTGWSGNRLGDDLDVRIGRQQKIVLAVGSRLDVDRHVV